MITSLTNPQVKRVKHLHSQKDRRQAQRFIVEGLRLVEEALRADNITHHWRRSRGGSAEAQGLTSDRVSIPMLGQAESLNAAGAILFEVARQRSLAQKPLLC